MDLNQVRFLEHGSCEALTASIGDLPSASRREKKIVLRSNQYLWLATDPPQNVYSLASGRIEITETDQTGKSVSLQVVRPGEIFGYLCFCDHRVEPHGTEARAVTASVVHRTSYREFQLALKKDAAIAARLTEALCSRVSEAERRSRVRAIHNARKRLVTLLHHLVAASPATSSGDTVLLHLSHAQLAAQASLTRSHTTVLMTRLRTLGCISYGRGTAVQVHMTKLTTLLDE